VGRLSWLDALLLPYGIEMLIKCHDSVLWPKVSFLACIVNCIVFVVRPMCRGMKGARIAYGVKDALGKSLGGQVYHHVWKDEWRS
jgi:hypothetical protein